MTRDDRIMMTAIATTFVLSALVMATIVVKGSAIHDRFFFDSDPIAAALRLLPARPAAIAAQSESSPQPSDLAASTPFPHYWPSAQRSRHLVVPAPAVTVLVGDDRAFSFEADHRNRDER